MLTGLSYASLGSRYPRAAGAAYVAHRAYGHGLLTHVVGLTVACSGLTSIAAGARVIAENFQRLPGFGAWPLLALTFLYLLLLGAIVFRGIRESMWANVACTVVEAGGLLLVLAVGMRYWGTADLLDMPPRADGESGFSLVLIIQGVVLTFYSFIGFEDSFNVAEEVKNPRRNIPLGLIAALIFTACIYIGVAVTAVSVVPWQELAQARAPLAEVMARAAPWFPTVAFLAITIFSVGNTGLINYITTSRLLYGMARDGRLPQALAAVHPARRTPHNAIFLVFAILGALVLSGDISQLASATVLLLLLVFTAINGALAILILRPGEEKGGFEIPVILPILGALVCFGLFLARVSSGDWRAPAIAVALIAVATGLYFVIKPANARP
jgi:amino acid transporter